MSNKKIRTNKPVSITQKEWQVLPAHQAFTNRYTISPRGHISKKATQTSRQEMLLQSEAAKIADAKTKQKTQELKQLRINEQIIAKAKKKQTKKIKADSKQLNRENKAQAHSDKRSNVKKVKQIKHQDKFATLKAILDRPDVLEHINMPIDQYIGKYGDTLFSTKTRFKNLMSKFPGFKKWAMDDMAVKMAMNTPTPANIANATNTVIKQFKQVDRKAASEFKMQMAKFSPFIVMVLLYAAMKDNG